ncbi:hypothetical protein GF374_02340, partial [Candidatus Woesearchaeota archaeon]|nr:hypothetical protein [Candidatus Woesearchaeota archaeon]
MGGTWFRGAIICFVFLLLLPCASAIGIAPAQIDIDYQGPTSTTLTFYAINSENTETKVEAYIDGDLANHIKLEETEFKLKPNEVKSFKVKLTLPSNVPSGKHTNIIGITEKINTSSENVAALATVKSKLIVNNFEKGLKSLQIDLKASNASEKGETVNFQVDLTNPSKEDSYGISGGVTVYNSSKEIEKISFNQIDVPAGEKVSVNQKWSTQDVSIGEYKAKLTLKDEFTTYHDETNFLVGEPLIKISKVDIDPQISTDGNVTKFVISIKNEWNSLLKDVYVVIKILEDEKVIGEIKSSPVDVGPYETVNLVAYWDGIYDSSVHDIDVTVFYGDKSSNIM